MSSLAARFYSSQGDICCWKQTRCPEEPQTNLKSSLQSAPDSLTSLEQNPSAFILLLTTTDDSAVATNELLDF